MGKVRGSFESHYSSRDWDIKNRSVKKISQSKRRNVNKNVDEAIRRRIKNLRTPEVHADNLNCCPFYV